MSYAVHDLMNELDDTYEASKRAWQQHVDGNCPDCARSPFACKTQMELHEAWNTAWCNAKNVYFFMTESEREQWRESKNKFPCPAPDKPTPASTAKEE